MNHKSTRNRSGITKISLFMLLIIPMSVDAAVLYKSYIIQKDRAIDILCDPYVVQKDDYVWKLFREKGEISEKDFPEFVSIFGRLNPHIRDMDRILPGQQILIPLKKLSPNALPNQESGLVTIPFMTLANTSELLKTHSDAYVVKIGDSVSVLIARHFGHYGSRSYNAGVKLFQFLNPEIKDLNLIYSGQELVLPDASIQEESWYSSLLDDASGIAHEAEVNDRLFSSEDEKEPTGETETQEESIATSLEKTATLLDAKLKTKGRYFLPREGQNDSELDLDRFPMMELKNGSRIIFPDKATVKDEELKTIASDWPSAAIIPISQDDSYEHILDTVFQHGETTGLKNSLLFSEQGLVVKIRSRWIFDKPAAAGHPARHICVTPVDNPQERTPHTVVQYLGKKNIIIKESPADSEEGLKQENGIPDSPAATLVEIPVSGPQAFVAKCLEVLGYPYSQRSSITFPYAGIQIKAISNIILRTNNVPLLVDFGDFQGDAIPALKKTGFDIVQISVSDDMETVLHKILRALEVSFSENPIFYGAKRSKDHNISFTIPGIFLPDVNISKVLFLYAALPVEIQQFLTSQNITVVRMNEKIAQNQGN